MSDTTGRFAVAVARHVLTVLAGILLTRGLISGSEHQLIVAGLLSVAALTSSYLDKRHSTKEPPKR